jgi:hypothetical protein
LIGRDGAIARGAERTELGAPFVAALGEAVQQEDELAVGGTHRQRVEDEPVDTDLETLRVRRHAGEAIERHALPSGP